MIRNTAVAIAASACLVAGCGGDSSPSTGGSEGSVAPLTAAALGEQSVLPAADYLAQAPYASADRDNGQRLAQMCKACHTIGKGGVNMVGPNLHGFFGKKVGSESIYGTATTRLMRAEPDITVSGGHAAAGKWGFAAPGTFLLALFFLAIFVIYYAINWKYLASVWPLS